jgi:hypothetical protein
VTQFSLFGAAAARPSLDDLGGLLLAGGHWVRAGSTARLSAVVPDRWRADALVAEFEHRGVATTEAIVPAEGGLGVRTAFAASLASHAAAWARGAREGPPSDFVLTAAGLRLWALAGGRYDEAGYLLATAEPDDLLHRTGGAALAGLGVAAVSLTRRSRPGWRVTSLRRIRRLGELVGEAPAGGAGNWPRTP